MIQCFSDVIGSDKIFGIKDAINIGNEGAICSDIEYISHANEHLIIEAKSHGSKDAYNTRHRIFGQLLKEHGKKSPSRIRHGASIALGLLIPKDKTSSGRSYTKKSGYDFYRDGYANVPEELFTGFGKLAKVKYVFVCSVEERTVDVYTWAGFRQGEKTNVPSASHCITKPCTASQELCFCPRDGNVSDRTVNLWRRIISK